MGPANTNLSDIISVVVIIVLESLSMYFPAGNVSNKE